MTASFVRLVAVTKQYGGEGGIDGVSLDVGKGECAVVVGRSGSGKTTLLRLIAGLERPDAGQIWLDGRQVAAAGGRGVAACERRIGFVFQDLALWPHLTARQNLEFAVASSRIPKPERSARVDEVFGLCRIERALTRRYPHQLSGGEQQRVALARALVGAPRLLLFDEPFSSLDRDLRVELRTELAALRRQLRVTTIYVTHDEDDAAALADRTITLRAGRIDDAS